NLEGPSLPDISELAGVKGAPDLGPFKLAFRLKDPLEKLSFENLVLNMGTPGLAELTLTGSIEDFLSRRGIRLSFTAGGQNAAELEKLFGRHLPIKGAFSVSGRVVDTAIDRYQLKNFSIVLGDNNIDGWAELILASQQPRLSVMLSSLKFNLRPLSLPNIDELAGLTNAADLGPFKLQAEIVDPAGKLSIERLDIRAGNPKLAEIKVKGFIKNLPAWQGVELKFAVKGQEAAELAKLAGQPIPITGDFSLSGVVVDSAARVYDLKDFLLIATGNDIRGQMTLNLTGQRPRISAALSSQKIDLAPLISSPEEKSTASGRPAESNTKKQNILPEIPLTAKTLKRADAEVTIRVEDIRLPRLSFDDLTTHLVLQDGHVTLTASGKSIPDIAEPRGVAGPTQPGTVSLSVKASSLRDKLAVEKLDFDAHFEGIVTVKLDATAEDFLRRQGITIDFEAKGDDLSKLEKLAGRQLPYTGAFKISGRLDDTATNVYKFSALRVIAGDNDIGGWLDLNLAGDRPTIKAELISQNLDLRWLYETPHQKEDTIEGSAPAGKKPKKIFPDEPLPLDILKLADLDANIKAAKIVLPHVALSEITGHIALANGHLVVKPFQFLAGDGSVRGHMELHLKDAAVSLAGNLKIDHVQLGSTLQEVQVSQIFQGTISSKISITSRGDSLAALMASLNGSVTLVHQGGRVANRYFGILFGDLTTEIVRRIHVFGQKQKYTDINCIVINSDIKNGLAENVFLVDTSQTKLIGAGKVNLENETLDLGFKTSPKKGVKVPFWGRVGLSLGELTKPFKVSGTLASPSFVIDPTRTAVTLGKLTAGLMLGPAGLAVVFADVSKKDADPCREAINAIKQENQDFMEIKSYREKRK
ncbi:MAG: AsmA family protein, partial [Desulfobacterales bacterium]